VQYAFCVQDNEQLKDLVKSGTGDIAPRWGAPPQPSGFYKYVTPLGWMIFFRTSEVVGIGARLCTNLKKTEPWPSKVLEIASGIFSEHRHFYIYSATVNSYDPGLTERSERKDDLSDLCCRITN